METPHIYNASWGCSHLPRSQAPLTYSMELMSRYVSFQLFGTKIMSACTILTSLCTPACMQSLQCQQGKQREGRNGKTCIYPPSMINTEASPSGPPSVIDTEASPYNQSVVHMEANPSGPSSVINTETSPTATGQAKTGTESSVCSRACW